MELTQGLFVEEDSVLRIHEPLVGKREARHYRYTLRVKVVGLQELGLEEAAKAYLQLLCLRTKTVLGKLPSLGCSSRDALHKHLYRNSQELFAAFRRRFPSSGLSCERSLLAVSLFISVALISHRG